jgi:hypothetical protein
MHTPAAQKHSLKCKKGKEQGYFDFADELKTEVGIPPKPKDLGILPNFI